MAKVKRMLWIVLGTLLVSYFFLAVCMYLAQEHLLYRPSKELDSTPKDISLSYEEVFFDAADGVKLWGWLVGKENARGTILYCHGNAGNITHRLDSIIIFHHKLQLQVFLFDYRGYGKSEGSPSEKGTYLDVEAAWKYLTETKKIPADTIFVFGRSLGGPIAAYIAAQKKPKALILESTFTSVPDVAQAIYPYMPIRHHGQVEARVIPRGGPNGLLLKKYPMTCG